jgi:hypothetical protein
VRAHVGEGQFHIELAEAPVMPHMWPPHRARRGQQEHGGRWEEWHDKAKDAHQQA